MAMNPNPELNGPFRAENPFTMDVCFPGLTAWADRGGPLGRKALINPGSGSPPPTHHVDTIASRTIRIHLSWAVLRSSSTLDLESLAHTSGPKGRFNQPRPKGLGDMAIIKSLALKGPFSVDSPISVDCP
jgi:hypothetical protein